MPSNVYPCRYHPGFHSQEEDKLKCILLLLDKVTIIIPPNLDSVEQPGFYFDLGGQLQRKRFYQFAHQLKNKEELINSGFLLYW